MNIYIIILFCVISLSLFIYIGYKLFLLYKKNKHVDYKNKTCIESDNRYSTVSNYKFIDNKTINNLYNSGYKYPKYIINRILYSNYNNKGLTIVDMEMMSVPVDADVYIPTVEETAAWLRNEKNINIEVSYNQKTKKWLYWIYENYKESEDTGTYGQGDSDTYEECLYKGVTDVLINYI